MRAEVRTAFVVVVVAAVAAHSIIYLLVYKKILLVNFVPRRPATKVNMKYTSAGIVCENIRAEVRTAFTLLLLLLFLFPTLALGRKHILQSYQSPTREEA